MYPDFPQKPNKCLDRKSAVKALLFCCSFSASERNFLNRITFLHKETLIFIWRYGILFKKHKR